MIKISSHLPPNFDLRALQVFVVTAEQGGMTQSAKVLNLTQSGVSQTIASLEEAIGGQLFDRSKRPIVLTSAGRALLNRSHNILADVQNAYLEASQSDLKELVSLTIAMPQSIANVLGIELYKLKRDISAHWRIWAGFTPSHKDEFLSHAIDMMITEDSSIADLSGLQRFPIYTEPYVLAFPKDYKGSMALGAELHSMSLIRFASRSSVGKQIEAQLNRLSLDFSDTIEVDTASCQSSLIASGYGWGITTPICLMERPGLISRIQVVPIERGSFSRHMSLVARQQALGQTPSVIAQACRDIMQNSIISQTKNYLPDFYNAISVSKDGPSSGKTGS